MAKNNSAESNRKRRRLIPTREAGELKNIIYSNPADDLFAEAFGNSKVEDTSKPSTPIETSRPHNQTSAVHINQNLPSTHNIVDGLPSTQPNLPSTKRLFLNDVDGKPSTSKKLAVHNSKNLPSTKKDRHSTHFSRYDSRINSDIFKKIKQFCLDYGMSQRDFAEASAVHFIDNMPSTNSLNVDGMTAHDDRRLMISYKTKGHIINLYLRYNSILNPKSKWTVRDDEKAYRLNETDSRIIELGIIQTQFQKGFKGKINSFSYYLNEIDNFKELEMSGEVLDTMLKINRQRWQQTTKKEMDYSEFDKKTE